MIKVSVIIPMYNEELYISRCLETLTQQSYKDFEVILIDDWSKDKTIEKARLFNNRLKLTFLKQNHAGPGNARNMASKIAKWEIFVFVDADMFFDKDYIKNLIWPILRWEEKGTAHGVELVWNVKNPIARAYGLTRIKGKEWWRAWVFRAFDKKSFFESGGYEPDQYAFEDNFSKKIGWALFVMDAICYHNNPVSFKEIYNHEVRIWKSLIAKWRWKDYLLIYKYRVIIFWILGLISILFLSYMWLFLYALISIVAILLLLILTKTIERTIKEKYISHLVYIPIVMTVRWIWYIVWIFKYIFKK